LKLAFVVSWLNQYGGAERVLEAAHELFPDAPVYTSIFDPHALPAKYRTWDIRVSFLNRLPGIHHRHQIYLPFYPLAFESFDLREYDLVLSLTSAFAHGVVTAATTRYLSKYRERVVAATASTRHLCYCLTPARFLWLYRDYVERESIGRVPRAILPRLISGLRQWDRLAAERVDEFIAISRVVQARIAKFYRRDSIIIHPPVHVHHFHLAPPSEIGDYFLIISRLVPYKRIDLAVQAFNRLGLPLVIAGDGRDRARLEKLAGANIRFVGRASDAERSKLMARCRAFIFPGEEDFGIAPLEANAAGRPVIAFASGGTLDTVVEGVNGVLFREPTADSLAERVQNFDPTAFDPGELRTHAEKFDVRVFQQKLMQAINDNAAPARAAPSRLAASMSAH
jgi:glycosyltransferase involved in cell wall biosynthesis